VRSASALAATASPLPAPVPAEDVQRALLRALLAFDDPAFPRIDVAHVEARLAAIADPLADARYRAGLLAFDRAAPFPGGGASFAALALADARAVVQRWFDSDAVEQRRFVRDVKQLAMIAVYSDPAVWPAIGYAGPFEPRLR
jgi:hypothetical protein